jgi:hypothetical protein
VTAEPAVTENTVLTEQIPANDEITDTLTNTAAGTGSDDVKGLTDTDGGDDRSSAIQLVRALYVAVPERTVTGWPTCFPALVGVGPGVLLPVDAAAVYDQR